MTKKFTTDGIANELKGSVWFRRPAEAAPQAAPAAAQAAPKRSGVRGVPKTGTVGRTDSSGVPSGQAYAAVARTNRSGVQHAKQTRTLRRAYDLYESQLTGLRRIRATRELARDANVSMSELVREAIDLLLAKEGVE